MFTSLNITYRNLTSPRGMLEPDGTRGPRYTDQLTGRAITQGIGADGKPLDWTMPRWEMTNREVREVIAYLRVLR